VAVTSARRVVDQIPAKLGFPFRRGAGPFMSGAGFPLPLACEKAVSGVAKIANSIAALAMPFK
jgi:hypothetical protein